MLEELVKKVDRKIVSENLFQNINIRSQIYLYTNIYSIY